jgi:muramidase (phage lysozyme)
MSIFRETFPQFVQTELKRRQDGMQLRTPAFIQQLNTRAAWVRMTSGVNTVNNNGQITNELAKQYVLQGGVLNGNKLRAGLGTNGTSTYDILSPGGTSQRLGIRPMPGITNVSIQSKGAYGSLQEATVSFTAWDISQLEELEILYMRPGYTILLEFGWDFVKDREHYGALPEYNILDKNQGIESISAAYKEIYQKIELSKGTYDALLGYVKNYSWSARDDGGYDCTTVIISLGEILESLKCNWVPISTKAFNSGLLNVNSNNQYPTIIESYDRGIIPGLLHELWIWMITSNSAGNFSNEFIDTQFNNTRYKMFMSHTMGAASKDDRGGFPKPLGRADGKIEGWITLGSFCDLLNNYVLLKNDKNNPIAQITTYQTDSRGDYVKENNQFKSLECIASPLSISTNLGVCLVRNDNWDTLTLNEINEEKKSDQTPTPTLPPDLTRLSEPNPFSKTFSGINTLSNNIKAVSIPNTFASIRIPIFEEAVWAYNGNLENDIKQFVDNLQLLVKDVKYSAGNFKMALVNGNEFSFVNNNSSQKPSNINWLEYFNTTETVNSTELISLEERILKTYNDLFLKDYISGTALDDPFKEANNGVIDSTGKKYKKDTVLALIKKYFTNAPLNDFILAKLKAATPELAEDIANEAAKTPGVSQLTIEFLTSGSNSKTGDKVPKSLGKISNIYVNINFLYSQAISKNVASNDNQNTNNISIREYLQGILKEIQNSLGNINDFDIQVDSRNAIGRIIDINFTGDPSVSLFQMELHNTKSVVRDYKFESKIFPEMGSIIAISAQDATGVGKLGYDNATLVAWNEGIVDRLIPKKDFASSMKLSKEEDPTTFLLPFLTKMYTYFQVLKGQNTTNINYAYGGLNFAYRDFLANLNRYDERNNFKTIIPTELSITLDGIGGLVIGNLFKINQDIVPKGYRSVKNRTLAYIITKLNHNLTDNDWVTNLNAYPIVFENSSAKDLSKKWKNQQYPGESGVSLSVGGVPIAAFSGKFVAKASKIASFGTVSNTVPTEAKPLLDVIAYAEGTAGYGQNGYDVIVNFNILPEWNPQYSKGHPNVKIYVPSIKKPSTAAGRYQFLYDTWKSYGKNLFFNKQNQDTVGWRLINEKRGYSLSSAKAAFQVARQQIQSNQINIANNPEFIRFLNQNYQEWASLPNANGESGYENQGGKYSPTSIYTLYVEAVKKYI